MADHRIGVIINGATGRMGTTQHMANLLAIAAEGGLPLRNGDRLVPDLVLVGRDADRLAALAAAHGGLRWTTNLAEALAGPEDEGEACKARALDLLRTPEAVLLERLGRSIAVSVSMQVELLSRLSPNQRA